MSGPSEAEQRAYGCSAGRCCGCISPQQRVAAKAALAAETARVKVARALYALRLRRTVPGRSGVR